MAAGNGRREDSIACETGCRDHDNNFDRSETVQWGDWGLAMVLRFVLDNVMCLEHFEAGWYMEELEKAECFRCQRHDHCPWAVQVVNRISHYALGTFGLSLKRKHVSHAKEIKSYSYYCVQIHDMPCI